MGVWKIKSKKYWLISRILKILWLAIRVLIRLSITCKEKLWKETYKLTLETRAIPCLDVGKKDMLLEIIVRQIEKNCLGEDLE